MEVGTAERFFEIHFQNVSWREYSISGFGTRNSALEVVNMGDLNADVTAKVLESGENTSEHAVMKSASLASHIWAGVGASIAMLPTILGLLSALPPQLQAMPSVQTGVQVFGTLVTIIGLLKGMAAKVAYINGRSLVKAASINAAGNAASADVPALDQKSA